MPITKQMKTSPKNQKSILPLLGKHLDIYEHNYIIKQIMLS
jgi:hypothetical protein